MYLKYEYRDLIISNKQGHNVVAVVAVTQLLPFSTLFRNLFYFAQFCATISIFCNFHELL